MSNLLHSQQLHACTYYFPGHAASLSLCQSNGSDLSIWSRVCYLTSAYFHNWQTFPISLSDLSLWLVCTYSIQRFCLQILVKIRCTRAQDFCKSESCCSFYKLTRAYVSEFCWNQSRTCVRLEQIHNNVQASCAGQTQNRYTPNYNLLLLVHIGQVAACEKGTCCLHAVVWPIFSKHLVILITSTLDYVNNMWTPLTLMKMELDFAYQWCCIASSVSINTILDLLRCTWSSLLVTMLGFVF